MRPLVFACISSEGEIIEVPSNASVRAYAGLSLHANPILHDTQMRGDTPVLSHFLRLLRYGTAIYQTQEGVSPQTRAVLDGSDLATDSSFQWALPSPELDLQRKFLERVYLLGIKAWRHRLEHDSGIASLVMGHHRSTLDAFKATVG